MPRKAKAIISSNPEVQPTITVNPATDAIQAEPTDGKASPADIATAAKVAQAQAATDKANDAKVEQAKLESLIHTPDSFNEAVNDLAKEITDKVVLPHIMSPQGLTPNLLACAFGRVLYMLAKEQVMGDLFGF